MIISLRHDGWCHFLLLADYGHCHILSYYAYAADAIFAYFAMLHYFADAYWCLIRITDGSSISRHLTWCFTLMLTPSFHCHFISFWCQRRFHAISFRHYYYIRHAYFCLFSLLFSSLPWCHSSPLRYFVYVFFFFFISLISYFAALALRAILPHAATFITIYATSFLRLSICYAIVFISLLMPCLADAHWLPDYLRQRRAREVTMSDITTLILRHAPAITPCYFHIRDMPSLLRYFMPRHLLMPWWSPRCCCYAIFTRHYHCHAAVLRHTTRALLYCW